MHRLVLFAAFLVSVAVALPDVSVEDEEVEFFRSADGTIVATEDDSVEDGKEVDSYFRSASGHLVKLDSVESRGIKAFRYNYPVHQYSVKVEEDDDSSEDSQFRFVSPTIQTYSAPSIVVKAAEDDDDEDDDDENVSSLLAYSAVPSIQPVGFKPLFTGFKGFKVDDDDNDKILFSHPQTVIASQPTVAIKPTVSVVDSQVTPIAQEYKAGTQSSSKSVAVDVNPSSYAHTPIVYSAPTAALPTAAVSPSVAHVGVPTTGFVSGFNNFYSGNHALTYSAPTFYTSRPFFYAQQVAPHFTSVVNTVPFTYVVEKDD